MTGHLPPNGHEVRIPRVPALATDCAYRPVRCTCGWWAQAYDMWHAMDMAEQHQYDNHAPVAAPRWAEWTY